MLPLLLTKLSNNHYHNIIFQSKTMLPIEIETIDGHIIRYKLSADGYIIRYELSADDYEQLAHWYNIVSKECGVKKKDEEGITADKLKSLPPILLAKLKQEFINSNKKRKDVDINVYNSNKKMKR